MMGGVDGGSWLARGWQDAQTFELSGRGRPAQPCRTQGAPTDCREFETLRRSAEQSFSVCEMFSQSLKCSLSL